MALSDKRKIEIEERSEKLLDDGLVYPEMGRHIEEEDLLWFEDIPTRDYCSQLVDKFARFEHIDMDQVLVLRSLGKQSGSRRKIAVCHALRYPQRALHPTRQYLYMVVVNDSEYEYLSDRAKVLVLYHELCHIPFVFNGQQVVQHDVEDFRVMLDGLGTEWPMTPEESLPDLLKDTNIHQMYGLAFRGREE